MKHKIIYLIHNSFFNGDFTVRGKAIAFERREEARKYLNKSKKNGNFVAYWLEAITYFYD